ncbi:prepilin-type N-terminal cleavage/methylation domain-containing protein [Dyella terrae]|uniref:Prepilin-type N-terminal cleavage/methylation domain-containing protein n=2 Tax=Dyella TaxID=231454 RepID=A0A4R0YRI4_9GAMM|nr:prepilin-type N-terminal cleavage/methylation domain-containing protein [Dyella terrae]TCI08735.1 prepilin-type N-terminal cleavage/methylation domain-containing protein [Dyella soli]
MRGFSLLEVLGALVLLALLLLGVYSGIRTATHSVTSGTQVIGELDQLRSAQQFMRQELQQVQAVPQGRNDRGENLYFAGDATTMRFVAPLPGYLGKLGPQLQEWKLVSDGKGFQRLEARFALIPPDGSPPQALGEPEILMDGIREGHFSYRTPDTFQQRGSWSGHWDDQRLLPSIVRVELSLRGHYDWPRLDAPLRVDPTAAFGQGQGLLQGLNRPVVQ